MKNYLMVIAIWFANIICIHAFTQNEKYIVLDSVAVDATLLHLIDSMIYNNRYYLNLHPEDKKTYSKTCFRLYIHDNENDIEFGLTNLYHLNIVDDLFFFKRDSMLFIIDKIVAEQFIQATNVSKLINESMVEHIWFLPNYSALKLDNQQACVEDEPPGVDVEFTYDKSINSFKSIHDLSVIDIFEVVEEDPKYIGGMDKLRYYISSQTAKYIVDRDCSAVVKFVIEKDGSISNAKIVQNDNVLNDNIYLDLVTNMPKWKPGKIHGKVCRKYFTMPIKIKALKE